MTNSFTRRIDGLMQRIRQEKSFRVDCPIDGLSQSLYELGDYLNSLDDLGVMLEAQELEISPDAVRQMAQSCTRPFWAYACLTC